MSFGSKKRAWWADGAVYANVHPAVCYHSTPNCPALKANDQAYYTKSAKYASAKDAFDAGHSRPCEHCCWRLSVKLSGEDEFVRLTAEQLDVLRIINRFAVGVTMREIAAARQRSIATCHFIVAVLQKKLLVKKDYTPGHRKARHGSLKTTPLGVYVLTALDKENVE